MLAQGPPGRCHTCGLPRETTLNPSDSPFGGLKVIDCASYIAAPTAATVLADFGAEVIKIEPPGGDIMRQAGPMKHPGMGHIFINANRNKRSVVLDLKKTEQREQLLALCKTADVLTYNIRPAAMARLGLSMTRCAPSTHAWWCVARMATAKVAPTRTGPLTTTSFKALLAFLG